MGNAHEGSRRRELGVQKSLLTGGRSDSVEGERKGRAG